MMTTILSGWFFHPVFCSVLCLALWCERSDSIAHAVHAIKSAKLKRHCQPGLLSARMVQNAKNVCFNLSLLLYVFNDTRPPVASSAGSCIGHVARLLCDLPIVSCCRSNRHRRALLDIFRRAGLTSVFVLPFSWCQETIAGKYHN